jgi:hypothetical protein
MNKEEQKNPEIELMKGGMAFKLKDSDILLWISRTDLEELKSRILFSMATGGEIKAVFVMDTNITKAKQLHQILTTEKGMTPQQRIEYYEEILRLYKTDGSKEERDLKEELKSK